MEEVFEEVGRKGAGQVVQERQFRMGGPFGSPAPHARRPVAVAAPVAGPSVVEGAVGAAVVAGAAAAVSGAAAVIGAEAPAAEAAE